MDLEHRPDEGGIGEETVQQMLLLAERLRESHGGELDDEAIVAVSEATGAPVDYVRIALARRPTAEKPTVTKRMRAAYLSLEPEERRWIGAAAGGAAFGFFSALDARTGNASYGLFGIGLILALALGAYNAATSKTPRVGAIAGAILGSIGFLAHSMFGLLFQAQYSVEPWTLIPVTLAGALGGFLLQKMVGANRKSLGLRDPAAERQELLRQLHDLQDRLTSGEQAMTFLSVDIVGSTQLKAGVDPLKVEFTFTEYHRFIEVATEKYGGRVHSTAGDGVICAFDHPQPAFQAAKNIQIGIIELNTFRNRLDAPLVLRCGIHCGSVVAPDARDVKSVNFAHVIDVAAHLQKVCAPGGIAISREAAFAIPGGPAKIGPETVHVDGVEACQWRPRTAVAPHAVEAPPPFLPEES